MWEGLLAFAVNPALLTALLLAVPCGLIAGAIPGVGGKLSIVIALPFLLGRLSLTSARRRPVTLSPSN